MRRPAVALVLTVLVLAVGVGPPPPPVPAAPVTAAAQPPATRPARALPAFCNCFFEPVWFWEGLGQAAAQSGSRPPGALVGGVVPHHQVAGALLSGFFRQLEADPPQTLVLVGPNHKNEGARIATSRRPWQTDFGVVDVDADLIDRLVAQRLVTEDDQALALEHSMGALMPYVRYHLPGARVVPLVLHHGVTPAEAAALAAALAPWIDGRRVLVASVDFSHYLTRAEAAAKDRQTLAAIKNNDLAALFGMGDDHLDSPAALAVLLLTMGQLQASGPHLAGHTNSGYIMNNAVMETTSYMVLAYYQP